MKYKGKKFDHNITVLIRIGRVTEVNDCVGGTSARISSQKNTPSMTDSRCSNVFSSAKTKYQQTLA